MSGLKDGENDALPPREEAEDFYSRYELGEVIGVGTAVVRHCALAETGEEFAVKIIDKTEDPESNKHIRAEIGYLTRLGFHPNIIRLNDSFETESHFFLVFELAKTGELFELLTEKVFVPEDVARNYMRQIFAGVEHIHAHKVVHRDLKLENILMMEEDTLKISDFGFAADVPEGHALTELCGTPGYLSPEMIRAALHKGDDENRGYSYPVDMWGCGVILYTLLVGFPPFWHSNRMVLMRLIMRGKFEFLSPYWDQVSDAAKDLVSKLLATNPAQRLTASDAIRHPWMQSVPAAVGPSTAGTQFKVAVWVVLACMRMRSSSRMREATTAEVTETAAPPEAARGSTVEITYTNYPVSVTDSMYKDQHVRKAIDECAFRIYGHWVKKSNAQNRAALFENYLVRHTS